MSSTDAANSHIRDVLHIYSVDSDPKLCERVRIYTSTLLQWNAKISLTAITDPDEVLRTHFGESFFAASVAGITGGRVADIGTGAGFPGIPIRMVQSGVQLTLVEAVAKKAAFLGEVLRKIETSGVNIIRCRMEEIPPDVSGFDYITARALGKYESLLLWSKKRLSQGGRVVLLVGLSEAEHLMQNSDWDWNPAKIVPQTSSRVVLVGSPRPRT